MCGKKNPAPDNSAAWGAGLLCMFALVAFAPQDGQAANFEIFMLPAMTAAVLLARRGRAVSSGVAVAVATLAKQTGAATFAVTISPDGNTLYAVNDGANSVAVIPLTGRGKASHCPATWCRPMRWSNTSSSAAWVAASSLGP